MTDLMQEIDDDLRREKFEQLWKKHGRALMAVLALAVVLTGAWVFWQKEQAASQAASTATLVQSLKKIGGSTAGDAVATLEKLAAEKRGPEAMMARFYAAGQLASDGKAEEAAALYKAIAADTAQPALYRDLATLYSVQARLGKTDAKALLDELKPLLVDTQPWRASARELGAVLALELNDKTTATEYLLAVVSDAEAPQALRDRARRIIAVIRN